MDAKEELEKVMDEYNNKVDRMQERVRDKQQEAHELYKEFSAYKWQVNLPYFIIALVHMPLSRINHD